MKTQKRFTMFVSRIIVLCIFAIPVKAISATLYVATNGTSPNDGSSWDYAFTTIQAAINAASAGDIIIVGSSGTGHGDGTYTENVNVTKRLNIKSESGYEYTTVVASNTYDYVFEVQADSVTIGGEGCGFSIYGATERPYAGVYLSGRTGCTIQGNRCGWDSYHRSSYGIYVDHSSNNTLTGNTCNSNLYYGICLASSSNNTLTGNICSSNLDYGIYMESSSNNTLTGNTCNSNSDYGIYLYSSSSSNTLTGNTCNSNLYYGIYLKSSSNNTIYLNNFSNTSNVYSQNSTNTWCSPTTIYYDYTSGSFHKNFLGNYYSDYSSSGQDPDGDGIGTAAYSKNGMTDSYPLMTASACYSLQAWWLNSDSKMYKDNRSKSPGSVEIDYGGSYLWIADQTTLTDIKFSSGTWTGQIVFVSAPSDGHSFNIEIGSSTNGSDFTVSGTNEYATLTGDGSKTVFTYTIEASAFTVNTGKYLALKITNNNPDFIYGILTGCTWSYCSSPSNSADYLLATTFYVATNGSNTSPYDTWEKAAIKIQTAIDAANNGDTIIVGSSGTGHGNGTYTENVDVNKSLTIKSESGYATTTVHGSVTNDHVFEVQADSVTIGGEGCGFTIDGVTDEWIAGIYLASGVSYCNISYNNANSNNIGIHLSYSSKNTIANNICPNNNRHGIYIDCSNNNMLTGNTTNSNGGGGIYLFNSSNYNILTNNTANSNRFGIYLYFSSDNTFYLNNLSNSITANAYVNGGSGNIWNSPTMIYYDYTSGSFHKNYLGNYYSDYYITPQDPDGDGIGFSAYSGTGMTDSYPLMATSDHYSLQAWWLNSDSKMYKDDRSKVPGSITISGTAPDNYNIWIADQAAPIDINFSDEDSWTGQVAFTSAPASGETFTVEIGLSTNGSDFIAGGPDATISGKDTVAVFTFETDSSAFTIGMGNYLALKITNNSSSNYAVQTGGAWSYCSAPNNSNNYSLPTLYVATNGSDTAPYDTWAKAATRIQTAVDSASIGDIIIVGSSSGHGNGSYEENVNVTKSLIIRSENGSATTTVTAQDANDHVFEVSTNNVTIGTDNHGFSIHGANVVWKAGIYLENGVSHCNITDNIATNNSVGIFLGSSSTYDTLKNNVASSNGFHGIYLGNLSNHNTLTSNTADSNTNYGIYLYTSSNNMLTGNTCQSNSEDGIRLFSSSNYNTLTGNIASENNNYGIYLGNSSSFDTLVNNTGNLNNYGIYVTYSSSNTLISNTADTNTSCGIYIESSNNNNLTDNAVSGNFYGIEFYNSSNYNTIRGNTAISNTNFGIGIISSINNTLTDNNCRLNNYGINLSSSAYNILTNNTNLENSKGFYLSNSNYNILTSNTANNSEEIGLYIEESSYNTLTGNTANENSNYGIYLSSSNNNTIYLNNLSNNTDGNSLVSSSSVNTWYSPTPIYYDYTSGSFHKNYLGNYYGNYTGSDPDGDGIGNSAYSINDMNDNYPLMDTSACYSLQAWWLNSDSKMYKNDMSKTIDSVAIGGGSSHIWIADQATLMNIEFSGYDTWTGQIVFTSALANGHTFKVEIGSSTNGSDFTPGGAEATITGTGSATVFTYETNTSAFGVATGEYLAMRITNNSGVSYIVEVGGAGSYCSSPDGSGDYLVIDKLNAFTEYSLRQNYPNPFSTSTLIHYELPERTNVILKVYDVFGREVSTLFEGEQNAGKYEVEFNGANLPGGIYFYQMQAGNFMAVRKLLLLK